MTWLTSGLPAPWTSALVTVVEPDMPPTVHAAYHDGETWCGLSSAILGPLDDYVTAWMPMPAAYGGRS